MLAALEGRPPRRQMLSRHVVFFEGAFESALGAGMPLPFVDGVGRNLSSNVTAGIACSEIATEFRRPSGEAPTRFPPLPLSPFAAPSH